MGLPWPINLDRSSVDSTQLRESVTYSSMIPAIHSLDSHMAKPTTDRLLLVESESVLAELASYRLELLGYKIECARSGAEALVKIQQERPRIVIVNTKLIDGDGLEWLARLRSEHRADDLPALVFSLDPSLETVERAFHAGAQDYLITPFDPTVLENKIQTLLQTPEIAGKRWSLQLS